MLLQNTSPLGEIDLPLIGRTLTPGETFEVTDEQGEALLEQAGNYARVESRVPSLDWTKRELLAFAANLPGVDLTGATNKAEILAAIEAVTAEENTP